MSARTKSAPAPAPAPETRPASEAMAALTQTFLRHVQEAATAHGALALRDAKLDSAEGWRYDLGRAVYVKQAAP